VRLLAHLPEVSFGDMDLSNITTRSTGLRAAAAPKLDFYSTQLGEGGWPSIRYFNGQTGLEGKAYIAKTVDMKLCYELGTKYFYFLDFVADVSGATLCSVVDHRHCDDQSLRFLNTMTQEEESGGGNTIELLEKRMEELVSMGTTDPWVWRRRRMVQQLIAVKEEEESAEEL
jgi:hypothetical protein